MNRKKLMVLLTAGALTLTSANSALVLAAETGTESSAEEAAVDAGEAGAVVSAEEAGVAIAADGDSETAVFAEDGTPVKKTVKAWVCLGANGTFLGVRQDAMQNSFPWNRSLWMTRPSKSFHATSSLSENQNSQ